ncbi:DUF3290 domain-containing protein [Enterococcus pseudoavium]|uniref:DUF3290 domain-containing protein n=1 Tax=Enterococcus pseudoavium TaxID=44007 RepID=A0ABU3FK06_9ENTE|nr:DUF3290 domain-containing protein [Enterococcus pseudoavium]MDT2771075.1 DUF3290 domain-containing protein [Enterococcus pseudoavium]
MTFYGIEYLKSQSGLNNYFKYFLIFGILILLVIAFSLYLRHRLETKYRDLSLISLLLLLFILGVQYSDYSQNQSRTSQSSQMVAVVERLAQEYNVPTNDILVNSTQLTDGTIVKLKDNYYRVTLNADGASFILQHTHLVNSDTTTVLK